MTYSPFAHILPRFLRPAHGDVVSENERQLLRLIWRRPGVARAAITGYSDLTQQSIYRIIDGLVERGMLKLGAPKPGTGRGQPSPTLWLDKDHAFTVGISVNTDIVGICIVDFAGTRRAEFTLELAGKPMETALGEVQEQLEAQYGALDLDPERLFGIGFAIAGFRFSGTQFNGPLPLHEWSMIELGPLLHARFGKPVWVENGANTGAIAEAMFGVGRHVKHFAYLSFNYGFGGGLVWDGELLPGAHGNAGEFSGMFDADEGPNRPAMQYLISMLEERGVHVPSINHMRHHFDPAWPGVAEWIDRVAPAHNRLIKAISAIFDPQAIVWGGQVPRQLAVMLIDRTDHQNEPRYGIYQPRPKLIVSDIEEDASAMGAAIVPFKAAFY